MPSCKFHRSNPTHKTPLTCTSFNESCFRVKNISSLHFPAINSDDSEKKYINFQNNPIIQLIINYIESADIAPILNVFNVYISFN